METRLLQKLQEYTVMIDFFIREEFDDLLEVRDDESRFFYELFLNYFRKDIVAHSFSGCNFFLAKKQKTPVSITPDEKRFASEQDFFLVQDQKTLVYINP
ncbi:MAG: hypothetical protein AB1798_07460, partial [Spirochaetota bacterium]